MPGTIPLEILTPTRVLFEGEVTTFRAPGTLGQFQVLPDHASMVSTLEIGHIDFRDTDGKDHIAATSGGYVEVLKTGITVLATTAEFGDDIDVDRATQAMERAKERLSKPFESQTIDERMQSQNRARRALERAMNRLQIASKGH